MRPRGDLCIFSLCNGCHELNERWRCANVIRAVYLRIFIELNEYLHI